MASSRFVRIAALAAGAAIVLACSGKATVDSAPSGGTTTTSSGSGGGGGSYAGMSCQDVGAEYQKQFELARICSPEVSALQCTLQADSELYCPCPRFVNPANASAVSNLEDLRAAWAAKSCPLAQPVCDAGVCPVPAAGTCAAQPQGSSAPGLCQDQF